jgi:protein-S-isoprenylcysteine O-methyltransferase Ste14
VNCLSRNDSPEFCVKEIAGSLVFGHLAPGFYLVIHVDAHPSAKNKLPLNPVLVIRNLRKTSSIMTDAPDKSFPSRVHRSHGSSTLGVSLFTVLRTLDPFLQYGLLTRHPGLTSFCNHFGGTFATVPGSVAGTLTLGLSPYQQLILSMSAGAALKQVFWAVSISQQELPVHHAIIISAFTTAFNCFNTIFSLWSRTSPYTVNDLSWTSLFQSPTVVIGTAIYTIGILTETISEIQRSRFKSDPANAGKPYSGGLFSLARNINYTGYLLWRIGYALAAGGPIWAVGVGAFFFRNFAADGVPELEKYCEKRVFPGHVIFLIE